MLNATKITFNSDFNKMKTFVDSKVVVASRLQYYLCFNKNAKCDAATMFFRERIPGSNLITFQEFQGLFTKIRDEWKTLPAEKILEYEKKVTKQIKATNRILQKDNS